MKPLKICNIYIRDNNLYLIFEDSNECDRKKVSNFVVGHPYNFDFGEWFDDFKCYKDKNKITNLIIKTKKNFNWDKVIKLLNNKHGFNISSHLMKKFKKVTIFLFFIKILVLKQKMILN